MSTETHPSVVGLARGGCGHGTPSARSVSGLGAGTQLVQSGRSVLGEKIFVLPIPIKFGKAKGDCRVS